MHEVNLTLEGLSSDGISVNNSLDSQNFSRISAGATYNNFLFLLLQEKKLLEVLILLH